MFFAMQILSVVDPFEISFVLKGLSTLSMERNILLVTLTGTKFLIETHVYQTIVVTILTWLMDKADISRRNGVI